MINAIVSAAILIITLYFEQEQYTPYFDIISLLCTQLWIHQACRKFSFAEFLLLTIIIMFAQGFTLQFFILNHNIFDDSANIEKIFIYIILTIILANPAIIKLQDRFAQYFTLYPYLIVMIDKVGQALTIKPLFLAALRNTQLQNSYLTVVIATLNGQVSILILILGITEYESFKHAFNQLKSVVLENSVIYLSTALLILNLGNVYIFTPGDVYYFSILQFIFIPTLIFYLKKQQKKVQNPKVEKSKLK